MKKIYLIVLAAFLSFLGKAQCPTTATILPSNMGTVTCNGFPKTYTAMITPSTNVTSVWYAPGGSIVSTGTNSPSYITTANPGTYSLVVTNNTSSCTTIYTLGLYGTPTVPNMTVNAVSGNTLSCLTSSLVFNITANTGPNPITYTWTNVTTSVSLYPSTGSYTVTAPGQYIAGYNDGYLCEVTQTITVINNPCADITEVEKSLALSLQPNPNNGQFNLKLSSELRNAELHIVNSLGEKVHQQIISPGDNPVNAIGLARGIYYYTVTENEISVKSGKLLIN